MRDGIDTAWAAYGSFAVGHANHSYELSVSGFDPGSTAGDSLSPLNGQPWSSPDNDTTPHLCAQSALSSWWFNNCSDSNPLGIYGDESSPSRLSGDSWKGPATALEDIIFKVRKPRCLIGAPLLCDECAPDYYLCNNPMRGTRSCCITPLDSCLEAAVSGVYDLLVNGRKAKVWCDASMEGGGWTSILRRQDGTVDFASPSFADYASTGVGHPAGEFMLSLELLHTLTKAEKHELHVKMSVGTEEAYVKYGSFSVGNSSEGFALSVGEWEPLSSAEDALISQADGMKWSTSDTDNDLSPSNCATLHGGPFWYNSCADATPLGVYGSGVKWGAFGGGPLDSL